MKHILLYVGSKREMCLIPNIVWDNKNMKISLLLMRKICLQVVSVCWSQSHCLHPHWFVCHH